MKKIKKYSPFCEKKKLYKKNRQLEKVLVYKRTEKQKNTLERKINVECYMSLFR